MIWDYSKLLGKMYECGYNQTTLAKKVKMSVPTFSEKINNKYPFTMKDIVSISNVLGISKKEIGLYFFTQKV